MNKTEQKALDVLLDREYIFDNGKTKLKFTEPYLGTLDHLSDCYIKLEFDEEALKKKPLQEANRIIASKAKILSKVIAIAWLNSFLMIKIFTPIVSFYFRWRIKPGAMLNLAMEIKNLNYQGDFINSIRYLSQIPRESEPKADLVEETKA